MPLSKCDRAYYPENWKDLALRIKGEDNWTCQHCDRQCRKPGEPWEAFCRRVSISPRSKKAAFVLGVAHLDQNSRNNARSNLRSLCSPCHLAYDRPFRAQNSYRKRERRGQLSLFDGYYSSPVQAPQQAAKPQKAAPQVSSPLPMVFIPVAQPKNSKAKTLVKV